MNQAAYLKFESIGKDVFIWPQAKIVYSEKISIGDSVIIDDFTLIIGGSLTRFGSFNHIAAFTSIMGGGEFIMEDFAGLSGGIRIYTGNDDYLGRCLTGPTVPPPYRIATRSFVHIKKHAIIGANSVILPGVTIGEGAAIGACSFVTKDCEPWTIYVGMPAKPLRTRPQLQIMKLEDDLRKTLYDQNGNYIPKANREKKH